MMEVSVWLRSDQVPIFETVITKFRIFATRIMNPYSSQKTEREILWFFPIQSMSVCADLPNFTVCLMPDLMIFKQVE